MDDYGALIFYSGIGVAVGALLLGTIRRWGRQLQLVRCPSCDRAIGFSRGRWSRSIVVIPAVLVLATALGKTLVAVVRIAEAL